jgi:hypothetical protein
VADTGGGTQLVTVVDPSRKSLTGTFAAWARGANRCWNLVSFAGQLAQPFTAQTGYGGLLPISRRVPGDWATPTGLFPFGTTVYGNSSLSPTNRYPYHHLVCGDWWDEQPGSSTYDDFQHVPCGITPPYAGDSEALWTETVPYQHFINIKMPNPPDHGPASSCTTTCRRGTRKAAWPGPMRSLMPCSGGWTPPTARTS